MTRAEAIEIIKREFAMDEDIEKLYPEVVEARDMAISALEQEPCDDAIGRADAQTEIMMSKSIVAFDRDLWIKTKDAVQILRELPSVQPSRKGHWIIKDRYYHDTVTAECSECGREVEIPTCMSELMYNGCPYCLADMRGDTE